MRITFLGLILAALTACNDPTGTGIACEAEKRAELSARLGTDFTPTDALLRQSHWTIGTTEITWAPNCAMTGTP